MMVSMSSSLEDTRKENQPEVPQGCLDYSVCTVQNPLELKITDLAKVGSLHKNRICLFLGC